MQKVFVTHSEKIKALRDNEYFSTLNDEILDEIAKEAQLYHFEAEDIISWEGEHCSGLHFIQEGSVKLFKTSHNGRELILRIHTEGTTFNDVPVFDGGLNPLSVAAMEESLIWIIDAAFLQDYLRKYPEIAYSVVSNLCHNLRTMVTMVEELSFCQVTNRLARLIMRLPADRLQGNVNDRLTQEEIASRLGTVREVVARSLRELERSGAISVDRGRIEIMDADILEQWTLLPDTQN